MNECIESDLMRRGDRRQGEVIESVYAVIETRI